MRNCLSACASPARRRNLERFNGHQSRRQAGSHSHALRYLITNVDDHLQNIGFLYSGRNQWRLSPAFDLNPFPDKDPESKTWLSEDSGPITSIKQLMGQAARFELSSSQAQTVFEEVATAVKRWKEVALSPAVGLQAHDINDFKPAFESKAFR